MTLRSPIFRRLLRLPTIPAWRVLALLVLAAVALAGERVAAQQPTSASLPAAPVVSDTMRIDDGSGLARGARIAALDSERVTAAWTLTDGVAPGVYLRHRTGLVGVWQPVERVAGDAGRQPRDLAMAHDAQGRLHLVWTALSGSQRRLFHARADRPGEPPVARPLLPVMVDPEFDADFPLIAQVPGLGMVVVWQASDVVRFRVRAAAVGDDGEIRDLGFVSGDSLVAMAPQLISGDPLRVAWWRIDGGGGRIMIEEWDGDGWKSSPLLPLAANVPRSGHVTLLARGNRLAACWPETTGAASGRIHLMVAQHDGQTTRVVERRWALGLPPGEHARPVLDGDIDGELTLSWQTFAEGRQVICLRTMPPEVPEAPPLMMPSAGHRFAAAPEHVTRDRWSGVLWADDAQDGGDGGLYFNEVRWGAR